MSTMRSTPNHQRFRRRFVNDRFVDVIAVPPGGRFKSRYEAEVRSALPCGSTLSHYKIDGSYRRSETPAWVYARFGLKK